MLAKRPSPRRSPTPIRSAEPAKWPQERGAAGGAQDRDLAGSRHLTGRRDFAGSELPGGVAASSPTILQQEGRVGGVQLWGVFSVL